MIQKLKKAAKDLKQSWEDVQESLKEDPWRRKKKKREKKKQEEENHTGRT